MQVGQWLYQGPHQFLIFFAKQIRGSTPPEANGLTVRLPRGVRRSVDHRGRFPSCFAVATARRTYSRMTDRCVGPGYGQPVNRAWISKNSTFHLSFIERRFQQMAKQEDYDLQRPIPGGNGHNAPHTAGGLPQWNSCRAGADLVGERPEKLRGRFGSEGGGTGPVRWRCSTNSAAFLMNCRPCDSPACD